MKTCAYLSNWYNKVIISRLLWREICVNLGEKKLMKTVWILFEQNVFGKTQNCASAISSIFTWSRAFCFLNWKFKIWKWGGNKKNKTIQFHTISIKNFRGASTNKKLTKISALNIKRIMLKKINVSFIVHFCFGQYNPSLDAFWTHLMCYAKGYFLWSKNHFPVINLQSCKD